MAVALKSNQWDKQRTGASSRENVLLQINPLHYVFSNRSTVSQIGQHALSSRFRIHLLRTFFSLSSAHFLSY